MKKNQSDNYMVKLFAGNVRILRQAKQLSQEELAEKCNLHRTYIGMIERCEKNVTLKNIEKLANALEVNVKELFNESE
jgi:transcriptional regulator with XRE-family HTH domain